jgi:N-acetylglutamate synthase-like GNAT family acetyltransferase
MACQNEWNKQGLSYAVVNGSGDLLATVINEDMNVDAVDSRYDLDESVTRHLRYLSGLHKKAVAANCHQPERTSTVDAIRMVFVAVDPACKGHGLAEGLINHTIENAKLKNYHKIVAESTSSATHYLFEKKFGFTTLYKFPYEKIMDDQNCHKEVKKQILSMFRE